MDLEEFLMGKIILRLAVNRIINAEITERREIFALSIFNIKLAFQI